MSTTGRSSPSAPPPGTTETSKALVQLFVTLGQFVSPHDLSNFLTCFIPCAAGVLEARTARSHMQGHNFVLLLLILFHILMF